MQKQCSTQKRIFRNVTKDLNILECLKLKAMQHNIIVIQISIHGIYIYNIRTLSKEELGYTKGVIRIRKSKDRQRNGQTKKDKHRSIKHYI
jgi:hypothetical protein